ncbi:MAG TPA: hypothetical protein VLT33_07855 [Labilithrix sp.]|nr:hypothetical protein [Labilithrix sp.]
MATKRITVSLPVDIAVQLQRAAARRHSVSEWVADAVTRTLAEEHLRERFLAFCDGVKATPAEERRAKASFDRITKVVRTKRGGRGKSAA